MKRVFIILFLHFGFSQTLYDRFLDMEKNLSKLQENIKLIKAKSKLKLIEKENRNFKNIEKIKKELSEIKEELAKEKLKNSRDRLDLFISFKSAFHSFKNQYFPSDVKKNESLFENYLKLNGIYDYTSSLSFNSQLSFYNQSGNSDLITDRDSINFSQAYVYYKNFFNTNWDIKIGRKSTKNLDLENTNKDFLIGHLFDLTVDGVGFYFNIDEKFGFKNASFSLSFDKTNLNFKENFKTKNTNILSLNFSPYKDDEYFVDSTFVYLSNIFGVKKLPKNGDLYSLNVSNLGKLLGLNLIFKYSHNDYTSYYSSLAFTKSLPKAKMFGSSKSKLGHSLLLGFSLPSIFREKGYIGFEFNYGSKYWCSLNSKYSVNNKYLARGRAYEIYFGEPLIKDVLNFKVSYLMIDYKYRGSDGLFGEFGSPNSKVPGISHIKDFKLSLEYDF